MTTLSVWSPSCMDDDDWNEWQAGNQRLPVAYRAKRPCDDCPMDFALQMRARNKCNGEPGDVESDESAVVEPVFHAPLAATTRERGYPLRRGEVIMAEPARLDRPRKTAGQELEVAAREGLLFITRAFRGAVSLEEKDNRALLSVASSVVGNWAKYRQSTSAMEQTHFAMATTLAKDSERPLVEMMKLTMPEHRVTKALGGQPVMIGDGATNPE